MNDAQIMDLINDWLANGIIIRNSDGTYSLCDEMHLVVQDMINKRPELYSKIFPDRLN